MVTFTPNKPIFNSIFLVCKKSPFSYSPEQISTDQNLASTQVPQQLICIFTVYSVPTSISLYYAVHTIM